jgi:molybdopterin/thiamine biosynthesis adenylyltransferase
LVRKGIVFLDIFDDDNVEVQNLTRQLFSPKDLKKNKAHCSAKILSKQGYFNSTISGYAFRFQEGLEAGFDYSKYDVIVCGVDNNPTRVAVAKFCFNHSLPLVMSAVSRDGNQLYCAIQEPKEACFACIQPTAVDDSTSPCNLPGIIDVIQVLAGFTVFAVDTVLLKRHREWNLRALTLDGFMPDTSRVIPKRKDCPICGSGVSQ